MKDLIERQAANDVCLELVKARREWESEEGRAEIRGIDAVMCAIHDLPPAQSERNAGTWDNRPTGTWQITDAYPHNVYCSNCHARFAQTHWAVWEDGSLPRAFCPNCGAQMEEVDNG